MYKALVRRTVRTGFRALSAGDYEQVVRQFHPQVVFSFAGPAPLGGERRGVVAVRAWFQRLFSFFPGIQFTAHQVIVQGWPWNTLVATRLSIAAPRVDGSTYQNEAMQLLRLRWGKVVEDRLHEDTYKLAVELQKRLSNQGTEEGERQFIPQEHRMREIAKGESAR